MLLTCAALTVRLLFTIFTTSIQHCGEISDLFLFVRIILLPAEVPFDPEPLCGPGQKLEGTKCVCIERESCL